MLQRMSIPKGFQKLMQENSRTYKPRNAVQTVKREGELGESLKGAKKKRLETNTRHFQHDKGGNKKG